MKDTKPFSLYSNLVDLQRKINYFDFRITEEGYNPTEVDQFLDHINQNLEIANRYILNYKNQIEQLKREVISVSKQNEIVNKTNVYIQKLCRKILDSQTYSANVQERLGNIEEKILKKKS